MSVLERLVKQSGKRTDRWSEFINSNAIRSVLEVGVYRGLLARELLNNCESIKEYIMLDPWRNMAKEDWNSVYNFSMNMDAIYAEAMERTEPFGNKRKVLRGTTLEKIDAVPDQSLDFVYIDGDHSLKGASIDLIKTWDKVKPHGFVGGHDFKPRVWKSDPRMEPYMVFPFAIYFAEAMNRKIYGLPSNEFLISKGETGFEFLDCTADKRFERHDVLHQAFQLPYRYFGKILIKKLFG